MSVLLAGQGRRLSHAGRLPFEGRVWEKARKGFSLDASFDSPQKVWMTLLLDRSSLPHTQSDALAWVGLVLSSIWQAHWKCVLENISWSVEACLSNIRNKWYGQLAGPYKPSSSEDLEDSVDPVATVATVCTENAKTYDPLFVPYHTIFAFRSDIDRYRKNLQPIVPFFEPPTPVPMSHRQYSGLLDIGMTL